MKYLTLWNFKNHANLIGNYPQLVHPKKLKSNGIRGIPSWPYGITGDFDAEIANFQYEMDEFIPAQGGVKLTDFLSFGNFDGLIVNKKALDFLIQFRLPKYHIFPIHVKHKKNFYEYFIIILCFPNFYDIINFPESKFYWQVHGKFVKWQPIKSKEEFIKIDLEGYYHGGIAELTYSKIRFDQKPAFDIFTIGWNYKLFFVTDELCDAINSNQLTGVEMGEWDIS